MQLVSQPPDGKQSGHPSERTRQMTGEQEAGGAEVEGVTWARKRTHVVSHLSRWLLTQAYLPTAASLILRHGQKYRSHFRPETIRRVIESARRLGYRSNLFAMSLNAAESLFFALVLHAPAKGQPNSWVTKVDVDELLAGAVELASEAGVYPIVSMARFDTPAASAQSIVDLVGGGVFASLVQTPGSFLEELLRDRLEHGNLVAVVFPRDMAKWESNAIDADNAQIAEIAARVLTLHGRRHWMVVHEDAGCEGMTLRRATFEHLASEAGIAVRRVEVPFGSDWAVIGDQLAEQVKRHHTDGLFAPTLATSVGALHACRLLKLRPGEDLSIIGCDCDRWARGSLPQLTYVDISWSEAGRLAVQKLLDLRETRAASIREHPVALADRVWRHVSGAQGFRFRRHR